MTKLLAVAAVDEGTAEDAIRAIQVKYQKLSHLVTDGEPPEGAGETQGPVSMDDLGDMIDNQVPDNQIVSQLQQYGISFKPSEEDLKEAKDDGVSDQVIDAIRKSQVHLEAAGGQPKSNYQKAASQTLGDVEKPFPRPKPYPRVSTALRSSRTVAWKRMVRLLNGPTPITCSCTCPRRTFRASPGRWLSP